MDKELKNENQKKERRYFTNDAERMKYQQFKYNLCNASKDISMRKWKTTAQVARVAGTNQNSMNDVYCLRLDRLTVSQLVRYLIRIEPNVTFSVSQRLYDKTLPPEHYPRW